MSSDYNISYSYNVGQPGKTKTQRPAAEPQAREPVVDDGHLYAFGACEEINLPSNTVLLVSKDKPCQSVVTRDVAIALEHCKTFRTLQGHAEFLTAYMPELGGDVDGVLQVLGTVRDAGLLTAADDRLAVARSAAQASTSLAESRVFVITCDRPAAVERLLESMLRGAEIGRHESLYLIDDSRDASNADANRELVSNFNLSSPRNMQYVGATERAALISGLHEHVPGAASSIDFLLDHKHWEGQKTFGLSRTLCLLLSTGYRAIMLDDDVLCSAIDGPFLREGVRFYDGMCEAEFYPSEEAWKTRGVKRDEDPLRGHLHCLGLKLGDALARLGLQDVTEQDLEGSQQEILQRVTSNSTVLVTQNGTFGDPGTQDTAWCFGLTGDSLNRLLQDPATLEPKIATRQYWMGWSQPTFSGQANMSQVTGLDNTALLPPYFPAFRGEDQLFGAMVDYIYPDSMVLNYPWAVPHVPFEERHGHVNVTPEVAGIALIENYIVSQRPDDRSMTSADRTAHLINLLRSIAQKSDEELSSEFRCALAIDQANAVHQLTDQLRKAPKDHAPWRELLDARRRRYFKAIGRNGVPVRFGGVAENTPEAALWAALRSNLRAFADALEAWPALREAATRITIF